VNVWSYVSEALTFTAVGAAGGLLLRPWVDGTRAMPRWWGGRR
jgi:hypothetical protein